MEHRLGRDPSSTATGRGEPCSSSESAEQGPRVSLVSRSRGRTFAVCGWRLQAAGCRSGVALTFLVATLSPMPLTSLGAVMQRLGIFGLMEDEGFARVDLWGEMDKGSEGLE